MISDNMAMYKYVRYNTFSLVKISSNLITYNGIR